MAKIAYSKLGLKLNQDVASFQQGENTIEVKQYLPIEEKMEMISRIINQSQDDNEFYNMGLVDMNLVLEVIYAYTNITFTDKQKEAPAKLYDVLMSSGLMEDIFHCIPQFELNWIKNISYSMIDKIYEYRNSVYGILDSVSKDYSQLDLDVNGLVDKISDKGNIELLNDVLTKLG